MASTRAAQFADAVALGHATEWAKTLSTLFSRVALFYVDGTAAQLAAAFGMQPSSGQPSLSLVAQTPLRWTLEAAAPVVGAGRAPGGSSVANHLGVSVPRSYAVLPFVVEGQLLALAYVDHADEPLPMLELSTLLREMGQAGGAPVRAPEHPRARRPRRMATRRQRRNAPEQDLRDEDEEASGEDAGAPPHPGDRDPAHGRQPSGAGVQAPSAPPHPGAAEAASKQATRPRPVLALAPEPEPEPAPEAAGPGSTEAARSQAARLANAEAVARRAVEVVNKQAAEIQARRASALDAAHQEDAQQGLHEGEGTAGLAGDEAWQTAELSSRGPEAFAPAPRAPQSPPASPQPAPHAPRPQPAALPAPPPHEAWATPRRPGIWDAPGLARGTVPPAGIWDEPPQPRAEGRSPLEQQRIDEGARLAEQQRVAEAARLAERERAEAQRIAEQQRIAEAARAQERQRAGQALRLAEQQRAAETAHQMAEQQLAEAALLAEQRAAEAAQAAEAARLAEQRAREAARAAEQERSVQAARVAEATQAMDQQRAAQAARGEEQQAREAARAAEEQRAAQAETAKIAELERVQLAEAARIVEMERADAAEAAKIADLERADAEARRAEIAATERRAPELTEAERRAQALREAEERVAALRAEEEAQRQAEAAARAQRDRDEEEAWRLAEERKARREAAEAEREAAQRAEREAAEARAAEDERLAEERKARREAAEAEREAAQRAEREAAEARAVEDELARAEAELTKLQEAEAERQAEAAAQRARAEAELARLQKAEAARQAEAAAQRARAEAEQSKAQPPAASRQAVAAEPAKAQEPARAQEPAAGRQPAAAEPEQSPSALSGDPLLAWPQVPTSPIFEYHQDTVPLLAPEPPAGHPWRNSLLIGLMALLLAASAVLWGIRPARGPQAAAQVQVEVPPAARLPQMARMLAEEQLIRQERVFIVLARLLRVDRHLRAGIYQIPTGLWPWQVLSILHHGQVQIVRVTIPEGLTLKETAALLARQGLVKAEDFLAAARDPALLKRYGIDGSDAEGFLFPETYRVVRGVSAKDMVSAMVRQFFRRMAAMPGGRGLSPQALYDRVILASLVEREARVRDELPRVAGVFANRLAKSMRLESCASVQYILGHPKERLQLQDVRLPSPYNTYLHPGLPPGPIANAGAAAMSAALQPEKHDFLFFVALTDGTHRHQFSRSYSEHQKFRSQLNAR